MLPSDDDASPEKAAHVPRLHRIGWVLFLLGSLAFLGSGVRDRDPMTVVGSILFAMACVLFLLPGRDGG